MPPSASRKSPEVASRGAGERALLVAEELALHQRFGQGPAVDDHERLALALGALVDQARHALLAGAAFAGDEHGRAHGGHAVDELDDLAHRLAAAEDFGLRTLRDLGAQPLVFDDDRLLLERLADERA